MDGRQCGVPQWSDLPPDLLSVICKCLNTRDILRMRAVCPSWRSSIAPLSPPPLKLPFPVPPNGSINDTCRGYFTVTKSTIYYLQPSQKYGSPSFPKGGFWVRVDEDDEPDSVHILKPLSKLLFGSWHETFPKELKYIQISEFARVYNLINYTLHNNAGSDPINRVRLPYISKVVILSLNPMRANVDSFAAMAIFNRGRLCLLKSGDEEWTAIDEQHSDYCDVINYKGKFYAVSNSGRALVIDSDCDIPSLMVTEIAASISNAGGGGNHWKYTLIESFGDLLLVYRREHKQSRILFKVYRLDEGKNKWIKVKSLGDRVLFMGKECSFSVSARDFTGCEGNCICYADEYLSAFKNNDLHIRVFSLEHGSIPQLHHVSASHYSNLNSHTNNCNSHLNLHDLHDWLAMTPYNFNKWERIKQMICFPHPR